MPYHWHEETEIVHVISGEFELMLDGSSCILNKGDIAFIASGRLHGGEPQKCEYECIVFDLRMLLKVGAFALSFLHDVNSRKIDIHSHFCMCKNSPAQCLIPMFDVLREHADGSELIACGALLYFMGEVMRQKTYMVSRQPKDKESRNVIRLKRVFEMIESHPDNPPSLAEMSSAVGMVPKYFCRFFRIATHYTPAEYIAFYRIEQACYEIAATEKNVTEIAVDLGFSDSSTFIRCFKRHKGMTPGEYMKMIRTEGGTTHAERNPADTVP